MTEAPNSAQTTLLAIAPEQNTGDDIQRLLRDTGRNVRVDWLSESGELSNHLRGAAPALICFQLDTVGDSADETLAHCRDVAPNTPLIALAPGIEQHRASLMAGGATDACNPEDADTLLRILERELVGTERDAELVALRSRLARMEMRLDAILADTQDALATVNEGIHASINPTYADLFGFDDTEELEGVPLMDLVAPDDRDRVKRALTACIKQDAEQPAINFRGQRADESLLDLSMRLRPITADGETGVEVLVSRSQQTSDTAPAGGDFTGRSALYQALGAPAAAGQHGLLYVVVDELDDLQQRLGMRQADRILDEVASFLLDHTDAAGRCFRFQIGEFVLLTASGTEEALIKDAEALRQAITAEAFGDEGASVPLTASIGVAELADDDANETRLLQAMQAARQSTQQVGNQIAAASQAQPRADDKQSATDGDKRWLERLQNALDNDGLALAYHSIANLEGDGQYRDLLVRLPGENGKHTPLSELTAIAERHDLMPAIDRWVTSRALALQAESNNPATLFVPLSAGTTENDNAFIEWLRPSLQQAGIDPGSVVFRLDETTAEANIKGTRKLADNLKSMGFGIAISHYGATRKSATLIEQLPADFAILAAELTRVLGGEDEHQRLAELVEAARCRNLGVIARQVQDANSMARLWQLGVHYVQNQDVHEPRRAVGADVA